MITPDFAQFKALSRKGNLVALIQDIPADLETPVSSFLKLAANEKYSFLLESAEQDERIGRYSFIGLEPEKIWLDYSTHIEEICCGTRRTIIKVPKPFIDLLAEHAKKYRLANPHVLPGFCGGFVGFFSYECVEHFENIKLRNKKSLHIPSAVFYQIQKMLVFDHFRKKLLIVVLMEIHPHRSLRKQYEQGLRLLRQKAKLLQKSLRGPTRHTTAPSMTIQSNLRPAEYMAKVSRIKEYIRSGDCIQVVLSQRFRIQKSCQDFQVYRALRSINPSPYMFYFRADKLKLIGSSPELLVKKTGQVAEVRPIAGTRPRGQSPAEDIRLEENLKKSPKEMAEHLMLVDLGRNDLGRVCEYASVQVKNFARVERYSHVMHLVSDVIGKLKSGKDGFDLLKATFPAGTVSGAPKIRAMEIIDELEPEKRGPYAGCLGYFSFNHNMDMCITIRTLVIRGNTIYLQAGAGIVKDSDPHREYLETLNKAKALLNALSRQGDF